MDSKEKYQTRLKRFNDAVALKQHDRIPVVVIGVHFFSTLGAGVPNDVAMIDHTARYSALKDLVKKYDLDMAPACAVYPADYHETIDAKYYQWPGKHLPADRPFQYIEKEYMLADEYDRLLKHPNDYMLRVLWPRLAGAFEPLSSLPPLYWLGPLPSGLGPYMMQPTLLEFAKNIVRFGEEFGEWVDAEINFTNEIESLGYPIVYGAYNGHAPFDLIADYMRGLRGAMLDMFRQPDKLLAAIDLFAEMMLETLINDARAYNNPRVPLWLHRGAGSFMSNEQFEKFYWPSLRKLVIGLVDASLVPILYLQGDFTTRLKHLTEFPKGKVPLHFDVVDRKQAREVIGGYQCFWGNVPSSLLIMGTPEQVRGDVKELADLFSGTNGLIIDGASFPDETKPENLTAMIEAAREFGKL